MLTSTVLTMALGALAALLAAQKPTRSLYRWIAAFYVCLLPLLPAAAVLGGLRYAIFLAGLAWLAAEEAIFSPRSLDWKDSNRPVALIVPMLLMSFLLLHELNMVPGWTLTWEREVIDGFAAIAVAGRSAWDVLIKNLYWEIGALTTAHRSLFYGTAAHSIMTTFGYSELTLRLPAAAFDLAALIVLYRLMSRHFSPLAGALGALVFATSESTLFYGRYGSSPSGTFAALALAYWACLSATTNHSGIWWRAILAAVGLYVATLQYAVARIPACVLAILTFPGILRGPASRRARILACACFTATLFAVWKIQSERQAQHWFFNVRDEQIFAMLHDPYEHKRILRISEDGGSGKPALSRDEQIRFVRTLLFSFTGPELVSHLVPFYDPSARPLPSQFDPPLVRPYLAPFVVFLIGGLTYSARRALEWKHAALLAWSLSSMAALLFTNRVDGHRLSVLVPPFTIWIAIGAARAAQRLHAASVSPIVLRLVTAAVFCSAIPYLTRTLRPDRTPDTEHTRILSAELDSINESVAIGLEWPRARDPIWNHQQIGSLILQLLDRKRKQPGWDFEMLSWGDISAILDDSPDPRIASTIAARLGNRTILLAPADRFRGLARILEEDGAEIVIHSNDPLPVMIVRKRRPPQ